MFSQRYRTRATMHIRVAKRILRHIKGTYSFGVKFLKCQELRLHSFSDNNWDGFIDDMKSTSRL
jgi:hypothetical protein